MFGRRRIETMQYESSYAEAATRPRRFQRTRARRYDGSRMNWHAPDSASSFTDSSHHDPDDGGKRPRRVVRALASLILVLVVLAIVIGIAVFAFMKASGTDIVDGQRVKVIIPQGASTSDVAGILESRGVIRSARMFRYRARLNGDGDQFRAGSYVLISGSSYDSIVRALDKGPAAPHTYRIVIPEGFRITEIAKRVDALRSQTATSDASRLPRFTGAEYLTAVRKLRPPANLKAPAGTTSMEGLLFPATYELRDNATADRFASDQLLALQKNLAQVSMAKAAKANLTPYDVIIIASLIEREARIDAERPIIAAVIYNRLRSGEPLGIDATIQYAVNANTWKTELTKSDLAIDSPYNTRTHAGLPPTPIASPGLASLKAAAAPANVDYKYYVADPSGNGKHAFYDTYDEFLASPFQR